MMFEIDDGGGTCASRDHKHSDQCIRCVAKNMETEFFKVRPPFKMATLAESCGGHFTEHAVVEVFLAQLEICCANAAAFRLDVPLAPLRAKSLCTASDETFFAVTLVASEEKLHELGELGQEPNIAVVTKKQPFIWIPFTL